MKPKDIIKNKIVALRKRLERAYEDKSFARCIELEGAILYLEMVYEEIINRHHIIIFDDPLNHKEE